ncbi:PREDICTED: uncharacterized protein LOC108360284 [Rhagoletis zephyria]|uniref:uncharacterized protein LOC108360284 n=1 Tax=Rhagoletis zephyria TaxID=28612 RepID=UPI0008119BC0|nr:PREDICTED: uncharacterized protein LOC108360284 [Rhagoletis zephyria]XP_036338539.1 uncharacterized protein LOC118748271 [Rhagoletis pomonella]
MTETAKKLVYLLPIVIILIYDVPVDGQDNRAPPKLGQLVPTIRQENYELLPSGDKYFLRLNIPDGKRLENVELLTDENGKKVLTVKGSLKLTYKDTPFHVTVIYEADGDGYRARYMYTTKQPHADTVLFASANLLKSSAG